MKIDLSEANLAQVDAFEEAFSKCLNGEPGDSFMKDLKVVNELGRALANLISVMVQGQRRREAIDEALRGNIDIADVENLVVTDVDSKDYPDFVDAMWESGYHKGLQRDLTEEELIKLQENYPEQLNEDAMESLR